MSIADRAPMAPLPEPAERIRLRKLFGATQKDIAAEIGVTRQIVNRWEMGRSEPTGKNRESYSQLLTSWAETESRVSKEIQKSGDSIDC